MWVTPLTQLGQQKHLEQDDLWEMLPGDQAANLTGFQTRLKQHGSIVRALFGEYGGGLLWSGLVKLVHDLLMFTPPFLLEKLLKHVQAPDAGRAVSVALALAMLCASSLESLSINLYFHALYRMSAHVKVNMVTMLYSKVEACGALDMWMCVCVCRTGWMDGWMDGWMSMCVCCVCVVCVVCVCVCMLGWLACGGGVTGLMDG